MKEYGIKCHTNGTVIDLEQDGAFPQCVIKSDHFRRRCCPPLCHNRAAVVAEKPGRAGYLAGPPYCLMSHRSRQDIHCPWRCSSLTGIVLYGVDSRYLWFQLSKLAPRNGVSYPRIWKSLCQRGSFG